MTSYQHVIDELRFIMGDKGVFDVVVDDTTIYSKAETGRHAHDGEVLERFTELVGPDVPRFDA
jgi:selenoprotein W-related protein